MKVELTMASLRDLPEVEAFYRAELGRDVSLSPDEEVLLARDGLDIVGAARLVPEDRCVVLRTMVVRRDYRRQDVGTALLRRIAARTKEQDCFTLSWDYLERFYGSIGFRKVRLDELPSALHAHWRRSMSGGHLIAMKKARPRKQGLAGDEPVI